MSSPSDIAVVTGGTTGIGLATSRRLLAAGYRVAIFSQNEENVETARANLASEFESERIWACTVDLAQQDMVRGFFSELEGRWGPAAVLVCNAGISPKGADGATPFPAISLDEWNNVIAINLTGAMLCCQLVGPAMTRNGYGRIVLIGSIAARTRPRIAGASYVASKAALAGLTKSLVAAYGSSGITTNLVAPGRIITGMSGSVDSPINQATLAGIPAGRLGRPDDIAAVVEFLVSGDAGFINGAVIDVNGGEFVPA